jgi:hypothetical protein
MSPVIQVVLLTTLFVGDVIWQQNQPHKSYVFGLAEFRFRRFGKDSVEASDCDEIPLCKTL